METATKTYPTLWETLMEDLDQKLMLLQEPKPILKAEKAILICEVGLRTLQEHLQGYSFSPGEEARFYKEIKPYFLSRSIFYKQLHELELKRIAVGPMGVEDLLQQTLADTTHLLLRHSGVYGYLKSGATCYDAVMFFHPTEQSTTAIVGMDFPSNTHFPVCYDHVVGHLLAAELLRHHIEKALDDMHNRNFNAPNNLQVVWTDSSTAAAELLYALYAAKAFNNGNITLKDLMEFSGSWLGIDLKYHPRMLQEIMARKTGLTKALTRYNDAFLEYVDKIL